MIKPALDFSEDDYALVMRTNVDGVFWACTEFGRRMVERKQRQHHQHRIAVVVSRLAAAAAFTG